MKKSVSNLFYVLKRRFYTNSDLNPSSNLNSSSNPNSVATSAFTIVELLVVIVVIGILAAITIVSYGGVTSKANIASVSSDLNNASTQLKMFNVDNSSYPSTISTDCTTNPDSLTNKCLKSSINTTYTYKVSPTNHNIFCLEATKSSTTTYNITQEGQLLAGPCPVLNLDASNKLSYPGAGNNKWYDLSGNDNNGTISGATYSDVNGGVFMFDGVDDYVSLPTGSISAINGNNYFSISLYARLYAGYSYYPLFNKGVPGTTPKGFTWHSGRLEGGDGVSNAFDNSLFSLATDYRYYVVTYDGASVKVYINGSYATSFAWTYGFGDLTSMPVYIGRFWGPYGKEDIVNISIYNRSLTATEILQNFSATRGRYGI